MKRKVMSAICLSLIAVAATCQTKTTPKQSPGETPHLAFVTEYIRELAAIEHIRESGEQELKQDPTSAPSNMIHSGTLFQLELNYEVRTLRAMRLNPPFEDLIHNITAFYEAKITLWKRMAELGGAFAEGPKPGVDYGKFTAELPQIRARLDYIDQALFEASPLVFATLIDEKADSKGHTSHLIITKEERANLVDDLNADFGSKLDAKNQNWTVSAASVLKSYLLRDFKSSDEPWD